MVMGKVEVFTRVINGGFSEEKNGSHQSSSTDK